MQCLILRALYLRALETLETNPASLSSDHPPPIHMLRLVTMTMMGCCKGVQRKLELANWRLQTLLDQWKPTWNPRRPMTKSSTWWSSAVKGLVEMGTRYSPATQAREAVSGPTQLEKLGGLILSNLHLGSQEMGFLSLLASHIVKISLCQEHSHLTYPTKTYPWGGDLRWGLKPMIYAASTPHQPLTRPMATKASTFRTGSGSRLSCCRTSSLEFAHFLYFLIVQSLALLLWMVLWSCHSYM